MRARQALLPNFPPSGADMERYLSDYADGKRDAVVAGGGLGGGPGGRGGGHGGGMYQPVPVSLAAFVRS